MFWPFGNILYIHAVSIFPVEEVADSFGGKNDDLCVQFRQTNSHCQICPLEAVPHES